MKTKRPTPHKLPSGKWRCQVTVDGKRVSVVDEDKTVCQAKAVAVQSGIMEKEERKKFLSLSDAIDAYIESKSNALSPSTIRGYEMVKKHRFKSLMKQNVNTITKADVQIAVNQEAKLVSPKTISNAYGVIRPVLASYGVDVFGVFLPKKSKPKKDYLQIEEIGTLLDSVRGDPFEISILLALWLGLRRSEIMGLCWDCIDEKAGTITIRRTLVMDKNNNKVLKEMTKNKSSNRTIQCPGYIMDLLSQKRNGKQDGPVFTYHPDSLRRHIHDVCAKCGVTDTSAHGLRHTNAAVMRSLNISTQHAMNRGGWTEERTYKGLYSYVFDSVATEEDKKIDDFFNGQM
jgi:integrase